MKRVKKILQCQNHIKRALEQTTNGFCTFDKLEHIVCNSMNSITWDEYMHALQDLAANGQITKTASGFSLNDV